jgi:RNA polymerase sigma factor (TIGR02999 family)
MRQILIDRSRRDMALKRGGRLERADLDDAAELAISPSAKVVELDDALSALSAKDEDLASLLELRHFGGMTLDEIAALRQVSPETVRRQLRLAEAWLGSYMRKD